MSIAAKMQTAAASSYPAWAAGWHEAYQNAAASGGQAHIVCYGDSVTQGYFATSPFYANSWATRLSNAIAAETGVTPGTGMVPLFERTMPSSTGEDRMGVTGTTLVVGPGSGAGYFGYLLRLSVGATHTFTATAESFRIHYITAGSSTTAAFNISVDGGSPQAVNPVIGAGQTGTAFATISAGSLGSHTLTVNGPGTASRFTYLIGVEAIVNSSQGVKVSRIGYSGRTAQNWVDSTQTSSSLYACSALVPDLAIVELGGNDLLTGRSNAQIKTDLTTGISQLRSVGTESIMLIVPGPPNTSMASEEQWAGLQATLHEVAAEQGCGLVDITKRWVSYAQSSSLYADNIHPNNNGVIDMANVISSYVLGAV